MGLAEYHRKRDFGKTPEPRGTEQPERQGWSFVVQKHAATRLHYDFRLELDGVLKSWAIPKGPSFDPKEKRLAMQTEDHPIDYGGFEGVIPAGQYGGGTVLLWDQGNWKPLEDPHKGFHTGKLKFALEGQKLRGAWTLIKIRGRDARDAEKTWLLIKERDAEVRPAEDYDVVEERPESVTTGRSLEEIARDRDRIWNSKVVETSPRSSRLQAALERMRRDRPEARPKAGKPSRSASLPGARKAALPGFVAPQLATLVTDPPEGEDWLHEMKFDGYRILCRLENGKARLLTRKENDWTEAFAPVARAAEELAVDQVLIDGEVAIVLPDGTTSFNALQNATAHGGRLVYFAFDLLHLDGYDLKRVPLEERKSVLREVVEGADAGILRLSDHVVGSGKAFFREACRMGLEGIVSKRRGAPYEPGRGRVWVKVKCTQEQEFVIGGFTDPEGKRAGIGALLLGVYDDGRLLHAGKVGTGFTESTARDLRRRLTPLEQKASPFVKPPPGSAGAHWVRPELVAEVAFAEWTPDGRLRHPSFKGLREDKPARQVVRERAEPVEDVVVPLSAATGARSRNQGTRAPSKPARKRAERPRRAASSKVALPDGPTPSRDGATAEVAGVRLTHADRQVYPELGVTKRDLALFYESIADWILPHVKGRPTTLVRCPEGLAGQCFYQKHTGWWAPDVVRRVKIQEKTKVGEYLVVDDLSALIGLVQIGILEVHTWNAVVDRLERPDRLVFDLDPGPGVSAARLVAAALRVRERLEALGLESFLKTTGGKGFHVVVPVSPLESWEQGAEFAGALASALEREDPRSYVAEMSKARRKGRIFVDYLRNIRGATSIAAFSTRARPQAPVSVPLAWDELDARLPSDHYTIRSLPRRLATLKQDPWRRYGTVRQKLTARMMRELTRRD